MPKIDWEHTTSEVLTMQYCPGTKINRADQLDAQVLSTLTDFHNCMPTTISMLCLCASLCTCLHFLYQAAAGGISCSIMAAPALKASCDG